MSSVSEDQAAPALGGIGAQRALFEIPDDVAYFNTSAISPMLVAVREAGEAALAFRARPWRVTATDWFDDVERLRERLGRLLHVPADGVALIPATSYGLAVAARNLTAGPGDQVVVLADEYPSNHYTWQRFCTRTGAELVVTEREAGGSWGEAVLGQVSERTAVVAVPAVHWTNGALVDLEAVGAAARAAGAALVVDASQSLGALPFDATELAPDFVVSVGYKWLLGPFGLGCLYVAEEHRDGEPLEENWINRQGSEDFAALVDYTDRYRPGARRFDVGQRNHFELVPMAIAALDQLLAWSVEAVAAALGVVTGEIGRRASGLGFRVPPDGERGSHMFGIDLPREVARRLDAELAPRGVIAGVRGDSLRLAPHLHVIEGDIDRLIDGLAAAL